MSSGMNCEKYEAAEKRADLSNEEAEEKSYYDKSTQTEYQTQTEFPTETEYAVADDIFFLPITVRVGVNSNHQKSQSIDEFCIKACSKLKEILPSYYPPVSLKKVASEENDSEYDG